eukprot:3099820-Pyramimonas_sp.AAC.1
MHPTATPSRSSCWLSRLEAPGRGSGLWQKFRRERITYVCARGVTQKGSCMLRLPFHRCWTCPHEKDKHAFQDSDCLLPEAVAQHEQCPAFWLRGLAPRAWTATLPPVKAERWHFDDNA